MVSSMKRRTIALLFCVTWSLRLQHRFARIVPLLSGPARPYRAGAPSFAQFAKGGYHERMRNRLYAEEQELRRSIATHPPRTYSCNANPDGKAASRLIGSPVMGC